MYESYFGLRERPFELTPNPRFLFMTPHHREALSTLEYGLSGRTGISVLIGEAGTCKTTLVHAALRSKSAEHSLVVYLNNPSLTRNEFVEFLAAGFGLSADAARSKTRLLCELTEVLAKRHEARQMAALIIDEAQGLPDVLLEEIRLLANTESASRKLVSIVLAGQPSELADRLNQLVAAAAGSSASGCGDRCILSNTGRVDCLHRAPRGHRVAGEHGTRCFRPTRSRSCTSAPEGSRAPSA
jgi:type II secretory pathway predicted ATPase ExeA